MDKIYKNKKIFNDRIKLLDSNSELNFIKKYGIDYIIKYIILVLNSIGKSRLEKYIFVDEIKNANMNNNLRSTLDKFADRDSSYINFYSINKDYKHVKIGFIKPIFLILLLTIQLIILVPIIILPYKVVCTIIMKIIMSNYNIYLKSISKDEKLKVILMTEHHFFSAITVNRLKNFTTFILQHGAICDISYFYPIEADYFLAWGENSKKILHEDSKIVCTGTYKFDSLKAKDMTRSIENKKITILWPLRPIDSNVLKSYMKLFLDLSNKMNDIEFNLIVKKHPSSFSSFELFKDYTDKVDFNISFVDENLEDIKFDIAVIDNSTIGYDLFVLGKPFIVIKSLVEGELIIDYKSYNIPIVSNKEQLYNNINLYINDDKFMEQYEDSRELFLNSELNNNNCNIKEFIISINEKNI